MGVNFFGMINASKSTVYNRLLEPALELIARCPSARACPEFSDHSWVSLGVQRVLHEARSGRGFLQTHGAFQTYCPDVSHYFQTLKSARRLALVGEVNQRLRPTLRELLPDELAVFPQLAPFDVYAGDGHWHCAAVHDPEINERSVATGHFFALDLRRRTLFRLTTAEHAKEHDLHALKRLKAAELRQDAPAGRKVIYVWDKGGIDFRFWHGLKAAKGVYFISLEKANMTLEVVGLPRWDRLDPVNAGVLHDE